MSLVGFHYFEDFLPPHLMGNDGSEDTKPIIQRATGDGVGRGNGRLNLGATTSGLVPCSSRGNKRRVSAARPLPLPKPTTGEIAVCNFYSVNSNADCA